MVTILLLMVLVRWSMKICVLYTYKTVFSEISNLVFSLLILYIGADFRCHRKIHSSACCFYHNLEDQHLKDVLIFFSKRNCVYLNNVLMKNSDYHQLSSWDQCALNLSLNKISCNTKNNKTSDTNSNKRMPFFFVVKRKIVCTGIM